MINYKLPVMKRKILLLLLITVFCAADLYSQNANRDRLAAYKIGFFTRRLNLTSQEAEKFWPVYNEYQDMRNRIQIERQEINRNFNSKGLNMSDREMTEAADRLVALEVREAGLAQEFHTKIKTFLPPAKVLRFYQAENQYRVLLLNELRNKSQ